MKASFIKNAEGNWILNANNYAVGSTVDFIKNMVDTKEWTPNEAINYTMEHVNEAIADAALVTPEAIFDALMGSEFEHWYKNGFMDFVEGEEGCGTKRDILDKIKSLTK